ncbi:MAG: pantoate--beta-alanine ligase [Gammaproteobacteria bacterium]|nr:MAG: pantoate--beta-alanine ligase [Gammaproteobacteria bacterium]
MEIYSQITELRKALNLHRQNKHKIGFVPTMGNLHAGHLSLIDAARKNCDIVIASIFVNPTQFGPNEDLEKYPRTLEQDCKKLLKHQTDILFTPAEADIYPNGRSQTKVSVPHITNQLCGASRPGHFDGVSTIVTKLFNIIQPDLAVFGQKDFQQLAVIRQMVIDLNLPIEIQGIATGREHDGLAMSSRNNFLTDKERQIAPELHKTLKRLKAALLEGDNNYANMCRQHSKLLENQGFSVDYLEICDATSLTRADAKTRNAVILCAAKLGNTRLIDNLMMVLKASTD